MIALAFVICLVIYAICFWLTFGELERAPSVSSSRSRDARLGSSVVQRDGPAIASRLPKFHANQNRTVHGGPKDE